LSEGDASFLRYCEIHSETDRALFSVEHVNRLRRLMGREPYDTLLKTTPKFMAIHQDEMRKALELIVTNNGLAGRRED